MADRPLATAIPVMAVAMALIPLGDTAGKLLIRDHGMSPYAVAWARFALGSAVIFPFVCSRALLTTLTDWRVVLRGALITATVAAILTALKTEPIANVFGAFFVGPILSYFLSARLLGEPISLPRTALLFLGFAGVILVVKPGFGMTPGLAFAVLSGMFYACYLTASRWLGAVDRAGRLLFVQVFTGCVLLAPLAALPARVDGTAVGLLGLSGGASVLGNLLLIRAYRAQPASRLAPFVYLQLVAATVYGIAVFGTWPDVLAMTGLVLLIGSGLASAALPERAAIR